MSAFTRSKASRKRPSLSNATNITHSSYSIKKRRKLTSTKENVCPSHDKASTSNGCSSYQVVPDGEVLTFGPDADFNFWDEDQTSLVKQEKLLCYSDPEGYFVMLPNEILHAILCLLDHKDLANLAHTSSELLSAVQGFIYTRAGVCHVLPALTGNPSLFAGLGKLIKMITVFQHLRSRLRSASFFLNKLKPAYSTLTEHSSTECVYDCFGQLFHGFVSGWEGHSKAMAYCLVQTTSRLEARVGEVLRSPPGRLAWHEKDIRLLHQLVFLKPTAADRLEYGYWLSQILKPWPITFQAKLLYLLTGPVDAHGLVSWTVMCTFQDSLTLFSLQSRVDCSELASALAVLHEHCADWSQDDIISIFDELTTTPSGWCYENVAKLLLSCGDGITKGVLGSRAINGRTEELSIMLYNLLGVCVCVDIVHKQDNGANVRWFTSILRYVFTLLPQSTNRAVFISAILERWKDYISALVDTVDEELVAEEDDMHSIIQEFYSSVECLTKLSTTLLTIALEKFT